MEKKLYGEITPDDIRAYFNSGVKYVDSVAKKPLTQEEAFEVSTDEENALEDHKKRINEANQKIFRAMRDNGLSSLSNNTLDNTPSKPRPMPKPTLRQWKSSDMSFKQEVKLDDEADYRCLLNDTGTNVRFVRVPKGYKATREEIFNLLADGGNSNVYEVHSLPSKNNPAKKSKKQFAPKFKTSDSISPLDFSTKTNHLFEAKENSTSKYRAMQDTRVSNNQFQNSITRNSCFAGIAMWSPEHAIYCLTTGRVIKGLIEVITLNVDPSHAGYTAKSTYSIREVNYESLRVMDSGSRALSKFFRFKIKEAKESLEIFGRKTAKKKLEGKILTGDYVFGGQTLYGKDDKTYKGFSVYVEEKGNNVYYLDSEIEVLELDITKLNRALNKTSKLVSLNSRCTISDDRRLSIKKGDIVKVINISKNQANMKNSVVTVIDVNNEQHSVLLKQLKPHDNDTKEKDLFSDI